MEPFRRFGRPPLLALTLVLAGFVPGAFARVEEPPLPGVDGGAPAGDDGEAFTPLLEPGMVPPKGATAPPPGPGAPLLPPAELFPELPPANPKERDIDLENIPGLVLPDENETLPPLPGEPAPKPAAPGENVAPRADSDQPVRAKWLRNPREARRLSMEQKKPLLLFFSLGSDQKEFVVDGRAVPNPTRLITDDLTSQPIFNEFAAKHLILCNLHYQAGKTAPVEEPARARFLAMQKFKEHFKAKLPSLILLDHNGREIERINGYSRVRNTAGKEYSSGMILLDRLKSKTLAHADTMRREQERLDRLASQGYRVWKSRAGTELMAKIHSVTPQLITVMDEHGRLRRSRPAQLSLFDLEWTRRWQAGMIPYPGSKPAPESATAAAAAPVKKMDAAPPQPAGLPLLTAPRPSP